VTDPDGGLAAMRAEIERLHDLLGPDECAYSELAADVEGARDAARRAEAEAGRLRGTIAEMQVQLVRARQDQERYQRLLTARSLAHERLSRAKRRAMSLARRS
jgi:multidrug resistance efflux pump